MTAENALEVIEGFRKNPQFIPPNFLEAINKAIEIMIIEVTKQKAKNAGTK